MLDEDEEPELDVPLPVVLVLLVVVELLAAGVAVAGAAGAVDPVPALSDEAGVLVASVLDAAGFSDVSLPPGFILSE